MNFENIQMPFAKRQDDGVKVNIGQINEENRYDKYECIVCGSDVVPVAPNGKIVDGSDAKVTPHFKHLDANKCGVENFVHFWAKTEYIKIGDRFIIITDKETEYICNKIFFEKTITINKKKYTPDATIITSCGKTIHFEFNYSNKKRIRDYIDRWKELNQVIVEVDLSSVVCVFSDAIPVFRALYYEGKCFNLSEEDKVYYNTIGQFKLTNEDKKVLKKRKDEIEKLDYLWDEIRKIKYEGKCLEGIGNLIRSIETEEGRKIAIDILGRMRCGTSILNQYVDYVKSNIDRKLKLLNLEHDGYLIKCETEIPRLIYDRIFKGIIIKFYTPDNFKEPEDEVIIYDCNFSENILSDYFKRRIDYALERIKNTHNIITRMLHILNKNNKISQYKLHYSERTNYIDMICFDDYRNKRFVLGDYLCKNDNLSEKNFGDLINENLKYITYSYWMKPMNSYIIETRDSYSIETINIQYKFDMIPDTLNLTYRFIDDTYKHLPRYNFTQNTEKLNKIGIEINNFIKDYITNNEFLEVYSENKIIVTDNAINEKIKNLIYPIVYHSQNCKDNSLNVILNKEFTKDALGHYCLWIIKDFIEALKCCGIQNINNII